MGEKEILTERFEAHRGHLRSVAYRMLGSRTEAEDAVQETWLRIARADPSGVENLRGWLTTIVARICLDVLRVRRRRCEEPIGIDAEAVATGDDAERDTLIADSIGLAMLMVLERLAPTERVAFVLHDMFNLPFDDIAPIVGRSAAAARQLASRARQREVVEAFLSASRGGDFSALLAVLDPNVLLRADAAAVAASLARASEGAPELAPEVHGLEAVAKIFKGRAQAAQLALVEGDVGLVFAPGGRPVVVFDFVIESGRIVEISLIADTQSIAALNLET